MSQRNGRSSSRCSSKQGNRLGYFIRCGLKSYPRYYTSQFPFPVVCKWLGNSPEIAQRHYALTIEEDFERAIGLGMKKTRSKPDGRQKQRGVEESPKGAGNFASLEKRGKPMVFQSL